jgi:hypothetical protein
MAFCGDHCVLSVKINPHANLLFSGLEKKEKPKKQHCKLQLNIAKVSNIFSVMARFL